MSRRLLVLAAAFVLITSAPSVASPIFTIDSGAEWQAALSDGRISTITNYADIESSFPGRSSDFAIPTLTVEGDTFVQDFGGASNAVGGFKYVFPVDPDMNGKKISYKADPGANVMFKIVMYDIDPPRETAVKRFKFTAPPSGARVMLDFPAEATDPSSIGANEIQTDTGFRLSNVHSIWYVTTGQPDKIITNEINVTPEPSGILLAALAAACMLPLAAFRYARKRV